MAITYEPIASTTLTTATSTITFSSIAASWTDLRVVLKDIYATGNSGYPYMQFNTDTSGSSTNYSHTYVYGDGSAAGSSANTNYSFIGTRDPANLAFRTYDVFSYAGSTYKTTLMSSSSDQNGSGNARLSVGLWRSTSAITAVTLTNTVGNFATGTTAALFGIKAA
jgi:hypothetical protein